MRAHKTDTSEVESHLQIQPTECNPPGGTDLNCQSTSINSKCMAGRVEAQRRMVLLKVIEGISRHLHGAFSMAMHSTG